MTDLGMVGRVILGARDGARARIDLQMDSNGDPDLTLQLPLRAISGRVVGAFQVSGWRWTKRGGEDLAAGAETSTQWCVGLLGPRGGRIGTVRMGRGQMQALSIALRMMADSVDHGQTVMYPAAVGLEGQERLCLNASYVGEGLGGRLWTEGVRGQRSSPLQPIHPEDLDHCAGLCRLASEVIG